MIIEIIVLTILSMLFWWFLSLFGFYQLPFKVHIHHAYFGIILLVAYFFIENRLLITFGIALTLSDCLDHLFFIKTREKINTFVLRFVK